MIALVLAKSRRPGSGRVGLGTLPLPGTAHGAAFGQIVRNEARLARRSPMPVIGSIALPVVLTIIFGEIPEKASTAAALGGLSLFAVQGQADGVTRALLPTLDQTRKLARLAFNDTPARLVGEPGAARGERRVDRQQLLLAPDEVAAPREVAAEDRRCGGSRRRVAIVLPRRGSRRDAARTRSATGLERHGSRDSLIGHAAA